MAGMSMAGEGARRPLPTGLTSLQERSFVGRDVELDALGGAWAQAQVGELQVVLLAGEPGIGKTTLAVQIAVDVWQSGTIVLFGRCDEHSLAPFQPFVEALGQYIDNTPADKLRAQLGELAADVALLVPHLGRVLPEVAGVAPTGAETERFRVFEAVPAFLRAIGDEAPVMLFLDDLHWADRPTLQLLQHVIRHGVGSAMLIVGTYRDTDLVRTHALAHVLADMRRSDRVTRISMRGLSRDDVRQLVTGDALGDALWSETEGSPLFLREILRHLAETDVLARDDDGRWRALRRIEQLGMPEGLREVIGRRLTRLSDAANTVLHTGSVMGSHVRADVLGAVTDLTSDQILDALDEAVAAGVLAEVSGQVGTYAFTHALVRQALYEELSITRRVRLHQRVGEALEAIHGEDDSASYTELAFHFSQAAVGGTAAKAVDYGRRAAGHARSVLAYEEAARHLAAALEVAEDADVDASERADLLLEMGDCLWLATDPNGARAAFERVVEIAGDDPHRIAIAALGYSAAWVRVMWVDLAATNPRGVELLQRALALQPPGDSVLRARLVACLAQEQYYISSLDERLAMRSEAVDMARRLGDPETLAYVLLASSSATYAPETAEARKVDAGEAMSIAADIGHERLTGHAAMQRFHARCQLDETYDGFAEFEPLLDRLETLKDPLVAALSPAYRGGIAVLEGRFADAETLYHQAFQAGQEANDANAFVIFSGGMSVLRWYQGRSAEFSLRAVEAGAEAYPALKEMVIGLGAALAADMGDRAKAEATLARLGPAEDSFMPRNVFWLHCLYALARGCWQLDDQAMCADLHEMLSPYADHCAGVGSVGWGLVRPALGLTATTTGAYDEAEHHFETAIARLEELRWLTQLADTQYSFAVMLSRRAGGNDRDRALSLLDDAIATSSDLGMEKVDALSRRLRAELRGEAVGGEQPLPERRLRDRARARLTEGGRAAVARWTRRDTDDDLIRRFGSGFAQRALFAGITRSYQPLAGVGVIGDIEFELLLPDDQLDPTAADWWTIEVGPGRATARRGRSSSPLLTLHVGLADFVRLGAGELHPISMFMNGRARIEGDVLLALRIPEMFGAVDRIDV